MTLHERIAELLGWTEAHAIGFSIRALREMVRFEPPSKRRDELLADIEAYERSGRIVTGEEE